MAGRRGQTERVERDDTTAIEVSVTCASADEAAGIARAVVDAGLVACATSWPVASTFRWDGSVETADEHLLVLTTVAGRFDEVCAHIGALHSYDLPAITAVPVQALGPGVAEWIAESTGPT